MRMARVPKVEPVEMPPAVAAAQGHGSKAGAAAHDRELVRRAQREDKEAFEELVRRHQHRVFAVAGGILRRREDVEDIAQQVFVKAYFSLKKFDQRAALDRKSTRLNSSHRCISYAVFCLKKKKKKHKTTN